MNFLALGMLAGCHPAALSVDPASLDWGEVDFQQDLPPNGYGEKQLTLTNTGERDLDIVLRDFPTDRFVLGTPPLALADPPTLEPLSPGQTVTLTVGVLDYESGELTTTVTGDFSFTADGLDSPAVATWSYTPIRDLDTGQ